MGNTSRRSEQGSARLALILEMIAVGVAACVMIFVFAIPLFQGNSNRSAPDAKPAPVSLAAAKDAIPKALDAIYHSLDQGDPAGASAFLPANMLHDDGALDSICRPFTFRAYYVENVIARADDRFLVRIRALFKPPDERLFTMTFHLSGSQCVLESAKNNGGEWGPAEREDAGEIVRRFLYALKAGKSDLAAEAVSAHFPFADCTADEDIRRHLGMLDQVRIKEVSREQYVGLKTVVVVSFPEGGVVWADKRFYLEPIDGNLKIVRAFYSRDVGQPQAFASWRWAHFYEDPDIEAYTMRRFKLGPQAN
jgi:hypothetical protein